MKITANLENTKTKKGFIMPFPQTDSEIANELKANGMIDNYSIVSVNCDSYKLLEYIQDTTDVAKLNTLAKAIENFDNVESQKYVDLLGLHEAMTEVDINRAITVAENFHNYDIWEDIVDFKTLGEYHVKKEMPDIEDYIYKNIDFEKIGKEIHGKIGGEFSYETYISNYYEQPEVHSTVERNTNVKKCVETIDGLTKTAMGIASEKGWEARPEIDNLRSSISHIVDFWGLDKQHIDKFDIDVYECMEQHDSAMHMGGM